MRVFSGVSFLRRICYGITLLALCIAKPAEAHAESVAVVATIKPVHSLVAAVMGDTGNPALLLDGTSSPHSYSLRPTQRRQLEQANIVFMIDPAFESFIGTVQPSLPAHVRFVSMAHQSGVTLLDHREGGAWEAHDHTAQVNPVQNNSDHDHGDDHGHDDHAHDHAGHHDLHLWLHIPNAKAMVLAITRELGDMFPEHRRTYKSNARTVLEQLDVLDSQLAAILKPVQNKPFIIFHDAFQYFEQAYGLTAVGSITLKPEQGASAQRLQDIRQRIMEKNAVCVFREPQFDGRLVNTVVENTPAKSGVLDPLGASLQNGADLYPALLTQLAEDFVDCLSDQKG